MPYQFDRWAPSYDRSLLQKRLFGIIHIAALDACAKAGPIPADILDVGCGTGRLLERAADRWPDSKFTGVDPSEPMLVEARRKLDGNPRFTFHQGSCASLPLEGTSFDAAFSTVSFHHWGDDQLAGLKEVARVLRPGGLLLLADVNMPLLGILGHIFYRIDGSRFRTPATLRALLAEAGFQVLALRRFWAFPPIQLFTAHRP